MHFLNKELLNSSVSFQFKKFIYKVCVDAGDLEPNEGRQGQRAGYEDSRSHREKSVFQCIPTLTMDGPASDPSPPRPGSGLSC